MGKMMLGPLEECAREPGVTDIAVTPYGTVWVDRGYGMEQRRIAMRFGSPREVREYAVRLCSQLGHRLDDACPICDASTVEGVRVHAVIEPIVQVGAALSIRLPNRSAISLDRLGRRGMFPPVWLPLFECLVRKRASMLISGGTGSGKTTFLKALLKQCPKSERIVTVEETRELGRTGHVDSVSLAARSPNIEGAGAVALPELVKATVRMRPDRIVLGECRGEEIADLLRALNSGHRGGMATIHADSIERLPARLSALGLLAGVDPQAMALMGEGAFDVVVHVVRDADARPPSATGKEGGGARGCDSGNGGLGEAGFGFGGVGVGGIASGFAVPAPAGTLPGSGRSSDRRMGAVRHVAQIGVLSVGGDGRLRGHAIAQWDGVGEPRYCAGWDRFCARWIGDESDECGTWDAGA